MKNRLLSCTNLTTSLSLQNSMISLPNIIKSIFQVSNVEESHILIWLNFLRNRSTKKSTFDEVVRRKKLSIFDYKQLSKRLPFYPYYMIYENNFYGIARKLSKFYPISNSTRVEHGLILGSLILEPALFKTTRNMFTFSNYRKKQINNRTKKQVLCVGPYISYAECLLNDMDYEMLKAEIGETLLVFPSHSIDSVIASFNIDEFIKFIEQKAKKFDTVMVCLFWKDIELGSAKYYVDKGYRVVTAGHLFDFYFLDRLKTIIMLSDMTISNDVGTHVGYCIALGRPHYIFRSAVDYLAGDDKEEAKIELNLFSGRDLSTYLEAKNDIYNNFNNYSEVISDKQKHCIERYWGEIG